MDSNCIQYRVQGGAGEVANFSYLSADRVSFLSNDHMLFWDRKLSQKIEKLSGQPHKRLRPLTTPTILIFLC